MPQNYADFENTLRQSHAPKYWPEALKALWHDAKGDWETSHDIAQDIQSTLGSWIHAYLHRKEGDRFNSGYWYRLAERPYPKATLNEELKEIVEYILDSPA